MFGEQKISNITWVTMFLVAIFFDSLQALLTVLLIGFVADPFISICANVTFYIWLKIYGVNFLSLRRGVPYFTATILEIIPGIDMLPAWTAMIVTMWLTTEGVKKITEVGGYASDVALRATQNITQKSKIYRGNEPTNQTRTKTKANEIIPREHIPLRDTRPKNTQAKHNKIPVDNQTTPPINTTESLHGEPVWTHAEESFEQ